jgi:hypothetical protein
MAIERLHNIIGTPPVKKEQKTGLNQRKKKKKDDRKNREKEKENQPDRKGRVDIRI